MNLNPWRKRRETRGLSEDALIDIAFGYRSFGNLFNVTQESAVKSTAVIACLIVRAETFASLPVHVYRSDGTVRDRVADHPLSPLMSRAWNPMMTSVEGWRWKQLTEDIRGQAFVRVERRLAKPVNFWPMTAKGCVPKWDATAGTVVYEYEGDAMTPKNVYAANDVLHFKGPLVKDAWTGTSLVDQAATAIGLTIQAERFYERLLGKGNHFPGHLETDGVLKPEDIKAIAENIAALSGVDHTGEMRIFDRGLKYQQNKMSVVEADLTSQQLAYLQAVCRVFRVPPPLVQDWSRSTYTNSEQADMWFAKHTILPIAVNTERVLDRLFSNRNEFDHYAKFELDGLLRGDYKTRMEGHQIAILNGILNANEARQLEERNPYEGGEEYLRPLNMGSVGDGQVDAAPLVEDARERIRSRRDQDVERGRDPEATASFAARVAAPLVSAGIIPDAETFMKECLRD
jgi:HK97 family phage portal protein